MTRYSLTFDICSYWHAGTGRGSGAAENALTARDAEGNPFLPGRTLKGLLRHAVHLAGHWGYVDKALEKTLFGERLEKPASSELLGSGKGQGASDQDETRRHRYRLESEPGYLAIGSGTLPKDVRDYLANFDADHSRHDQSPHPRSMLFTSVQATAMNRWGVAKDNSLRVTEVAIPLKLEAPLYMLNEEALTAVFPNWAEQLERALPLIRGLGTNRTRGLGRVRVTLEKEAS